MATKARVIVIAGTTRGCGLALARYFIAEGHTVHGCGRSESLICDLQKEFPAPHSLHRVDVSIGSEVQDWAHNLLKVSDAPDILINNAAVIPQNAPLWKVPEQEVTAALAVNIEGTVNTIRSFLPSMLVRKSGVVVNFSSGWGRSTSGEVAVYCATKWAIEGLTQALSQEIPSGMAAVALNPGIINTEMLRSCFGESAQGYPSPDEWAKQAGPHILRLSARDNGKALSVG